jgi:CRP-like cAMP-binding protein
VLNIPLAHFLSLHRFSADEQRALHHTSNTSKRFQPDRILLQANAPAPGVYMILTGFACRYAITRSGERQILGFFIPGDICNVRECFTDSVDFAVAALTPVEVTSFGRREVLTLVNRRPELLRELWRLAGVEQATARQWLLNVGHRNALERLAHLLCEFFSRLTAVGLGAGNDCQLPLTQRDIADALALSPVHVNRTLMDLRRLGGVVFREHRLMIPDLRALQEIAGFDPRYLQIRGGPFCGGPTPWPLERKPTPCSPVFLRHSGATPA